MSVNLTFHGAAGCVTGSCARLETPRAVILIDCGLFQGSKSLKALNYRPFPFDPAEIDAVLLTHAHVDHSGLLPKLIGGGFTGPILATAATRDLCTVMLADAGGIQESEVEHLNRRNERRGRPLIEPIYTEADGRAATKRFRKVKLGEPVAVAAGVRATFSDAGHILGAASILVEIDDVDGPLRLLFSGDIGGVRVRARVRRLDVYSAHADANGLVQWALARQPVAANVFLAHGEPSARDGLRERLKSAGFGADAIIAPELDETFVLTRKGASRLGDRSARLPAGAASEPDWHNARAAFQIALGQALEHAATDLEREALLADLGRRLSAATQRQERIGAGAQAAATIA